MTHESAVVVDANVFLRFLVEPTSPDTQQQANSSKLLFQLAADEVVTLTTNLAVIAEVVFILCSPNHYGRPRREVAHSLGRLLSLPSFELADKPQVVAALALWQEVPGLSFVDCQVIEQSRSANARLASFDRRIQRTAGDLLWTPPNDH